VSPQAAESDSPREKSKNNRMAMMDRMYCLILSIMAILLKNSYRELVDDNAIFNLIQIKFGSTVPGIDCDRLQRADYDSSTLWPLGPALFANYPRPSHHPLRLGAETQSLYTAFDCVNIATGEYFETHDDVVIPGPFPLHFTHCLECGPGINKTSWKGVNQFLQFPIHACTTAAGLLAVNQRGRRPGV
jgi:hypothetical protein